MTPAEINFALGNVYSTGKYLPIKELAEQWHEKPLKVAEYMLGI